MRKPPTVSAAARAHPLFCIKAAMDRVLGGFLVALMALAVVNVLWQVFTRFVVGNPSSFTDELARFLLIWIGLFGAAYASGQRMHLAIDLLAERLHGRGVHVHGLFVSAVVAVFALGVMVVGGWKLVALSFLLGQTSAALQLQLGFVYLALPVSGVLIVAYLALFAVERVRLLRGQPHVLPALMERTHEAFAEEVDPETSTSDPA